MFSELQTINFLHDNSKSSPCHTQYGFAIYSGFSFFNMWNFYQIHSEITLWTWDFGHSSAEMIQLFSCNDDEINACHIALILDIRIEQAVSNIVSHFSDDNEDKQSK